MFILASASPRRVELLQQIGASFIVHRTYIKEIKTGTNFHNIVSQNAIHKAEAALHLYPVAPILGADTIVVKDNSILGKPHNEKDAIKMLASLAGSEHLVYTGIAWLYKNACLSDCCITRVSMMPLSISEITDYVFSGEPLDKAGAYAIQGRARAYITNIQGSYSSVVGLPLHLTLQLAKELGINLYDNNGKGFALC